MRGKSGCGKEKRKRDVGRTGKRERSHGADENECNSFNKVFLFQ